MLKTEDDIQYATQPFVAEHKAADCRVALLEAQLEAIPDAVFALDNKNKILYYNHHFIKLWDIPDDIIATNDASVTLNFAIKQLQDPGKFIERIKYLNSRPEPTSRENFAFKDGRIIERYSNVIKGPDGKVYGWMLYFKDITVSKNSENKLKEFYRDLEIKVKEHTEKFYKSEKRFRSLINKSEDVISLSDANGKRFYVSPAIEKITGFLPKELSSEDVFNLVHPDDIEQSISIRQAALAKPGSTQKMLLRIVCKNGGFAWIEGTITNLLDDENVKAIVSNYHDVTEKKKIEEAIQISNERFNAISEASNDAIWDWNMQADTFYYNDALQKTFGYTKEQIAGKYKLWYKIIHEEDRKTAAENFKKTLIDGSKNWRHEFRLMCADGTWKNVLSRGIILRDKNERPYRVMGTMQDITELYNLQQQLTDEKINKQKELIKATIEGQENERRELGKDLHDNINQLLAASKLYLDVAATQESMRDEMIKCCAKNLSFCMEEIRKLSQALVSPDAGVTNFADAVANLTEPIKLATSINIQYEIIGIDEHELSSQQQLNLYRIIQEHLNNILRHADAKNIIIKVKRSDKLVVLNINDDGIGFNTGAKRSGIGFKNIQSRTEILNGKMKIDSLPGKGCTLEVSFHLNDAYLLVPKLC